MKFQKNNIFETLRYFIGMIFGNFLKLIAIFLFIDQLFRFIGT